MAKKLTFSFDKVADVLYLSFGDPQKAISEEREDGILIRKTHENGKIVGITIIDFEKRFGHLNSIPVSLEETDLISA